jgi:hypothetical protein
MFFQAPNDEWEQLEKLLRAIMNTYSNYITVFLDR